jgi:hypothetical protein
MSNKKMQLRRIVKEAKKKAETLEAVFISYLKSNSTPTLIHITAVNLTYKGNIKKGFLMIFTDALKER